MRNLFTGKIAIILVAALILAIVLSIFGGISNRNPLDLAVHPLIQSEVSQVRRLL